jgi:hypothetical protein
MLVVEDHAAVEQGCPPAAMEALKSSTPKDNPETVTDAPPLKGEFISARERTGASKLHPSCQVPIAEANVINADRSAHPSECRAEPTHRSEVRVLHDVVSHVSAATVAVAVKLL